jgi:hypothetical protein
MKSLWSSQPITIEQISQFLAKVKYLDTIKNPFSNSAPPAQRAAQSLDFVFDDV